MPRLLPIIALAALATPALGAEYKLDAGHTEVRFFWDHAGVSEQSGEWNIVDGTVSFDPADIAATKVSVSIRTDSIDTGVAALDTHLKSADFFEAETYPEITFVSGAAVQTGPASVRLTGDLTIKETTHPIVLDVELVHMGAHPVGQFIPYYEGEWLGISAAATLLRSAYGIGFGAPLTSDHIRLEISSEMKAQ